MATGACGSFRCEKVFVFRAGKEWTYKPSVLLVRAADLHSPRTARDKSSWRSSRTPGRISHQTGETGWLHVSTVPFQSILACALTKPAGLRHPREARLPT